MSHMGIEDGHQTAEEYRQQFEAACPNIIYLLDQPECICWCDDPDPAGMGESDAPPSVPYVRMDAADARANFLIDAAQADPGRGWQQGLIEKMQDCVDSVWFKPSEKAPERGQLCLFLVVTTVPAVFAGYLQEAEDDKAFGDCDVRDQYGEPVGYEGKDVELWKPLSLPREVAHLPEVL